MRFGDISEYIDQHGYDSYAQNNVETFFGYKNVKKTGKAPGTCTSLFSFPCVTKIELQDSSSLRRDTR